MLRSDSTNFPGDTYSNLRVKPVDKNSYRLSFRYSLQSKKMITERSNYS